jgi:hypothetical protein
VAQPADLAALLAVQAWRWAPYDTEDPAQPAVYNTMWQVLQRRDEPAACRLLTPGDPASGKPPTTQTQVMAAAVRAGARPLTEDEWRRFMPDSACFNPYAARPCRH